MNTAQTDLRDFIRTWHDAVWNHLDEDHIRRHMAPECEVVGLVGKIDAPEETIAFVRAMDAMVADIRCETLEAVASGDEVMATCRWTGVHRRTGSPVDLTFAVHMQVVDGLVRRSRSVVEFHALLAAAGLCEPSALAGELERARG